MNIDSLKLHNRRLDNVRADFARLERETRVTGAEFKKAIESLNAALVDIKRIDKDRLQFHAVKSPFSGNDPSAPRHTKTKSRQTTVPRRGADQSS